MENKRMSSDRYIDAAIAFYVDSVPSAPLPMTPLGGAGSLAQKTPASGASAATATAISAAKKNRPQMGISTGTGRDSLGSAASRVLTPLSGAARRNSGGLNVSTESMFFPPDTFGEGVLSPVGSGMMGITPREGMIPVAAAAASSAAAAAAASSHHHHPPGIMPNGAPAGAAAASTATADTSTSTSNGRGFHGFGLQLPPTPQGHPAYDHSAAATPLTSTAGGDNHFKFDTSPPSSAKPVDMASAAATLMSVSGPSQPPQPHPSHPSHPSHPPHPQLHPGAPGTMLMPPHHHHHHHHYHPHHMHNQSAMPTPVKSVERARQEQFTCPTPEMSDAMSTEACYPHNPPSQAAAKCYQGEDMATMMHAEVPQFQHIVNYPTFVVQPGRKRKRKKGDKDLPAGTAADDTKRGCVMCGRYCLKSTTKKGNRGGGQGYNIAEENRAINTAGPRGQRVIIPNQNKGICTSCDVTVWIHAATGLQIKWCKGCKNYKTWAGFGHKGHLTKCMRCRDEQNKRYARQKADKDDKTVHQGQRKRSREEESFAIV